MIFCGHEYVPAERAASLAREADRLRGALKVGIGAVIFLAFALGYMGYRHTVEMRELQHLFETIQLEADHRPTTMTTSLVHAPRVWRV